MSRFTLGVQLGLFTIVLVLVESASIFYFPVFRSTAEREEAMESKFVSFAQMIAGRKGGCWKKKEPCTNRKPKFLSENQGQGPAVGSDWLDGKIWNISAWDCKKTALGLELLLLSYPRRETADKKTSETGEGV